MATLMNFPPNPSGSHITPVENFNGEGVPSEAWLSLGSNLPETEAKAMLTAVENILRIYCLEVDFSYIYLSAAEGGGQGEYCNRVARVSVIYSYDAFSQILKQLEVSCGRDEEARNSHLVPLDIDIVVWNGEIRRPKDFNRLYFRRGYDHMNENT